MDNVILSEALSNFWTYIRNKTSISIFIEFSIFCDVYISFFLKIVTYIYEPFFNIYKSLSFKGLR